MNAPTSPARILIVDDSEDSADITAAFLEDGGFGNLAFARSAADAFAQIGMGDNKAGGERAGGDSAAGDGTRAAAGIGFDLIVMDIMMPDMDGIEACARLRLNPPSRHVPILMLSAARDVQALNQAFVAGANDFVAKPVSQIDLLARVRTLLRLGREQERRRMREAELDQRNLNLQRGALDATLIDPLTRLARGIVVELTLRSCREHHDPAALALVQIDDFALFADRHGAAASERLVQTVAAVVSGIPAPLAAMPCYYGEGTFMLVQPRAASDAALSETCHALRAELAAAGLPHGNSTSSAHVTLSTLAAWGTGEALDTLAARVLAGMEREWIEGGRHVRIR